jgi:energy-coupling factor transporter ATP-binding protein EcfA2
MDESSDDAVLRDFAVRFAELAGRAHELLFTGEGEAISDRMLSHLGIAADSIAAVGQKLPVVERANLQLAIDELIASSSAELLGLPAEIGQYGGFSLQVLVSDNFRGPKHASPPAFEDVPVGVGETMRCVVAGLWLVTHQEKPAVIGVHPSEQHGPGAAEVRVEVVADTQETAAAVLGVLTEARQRLNVFRSKVLAFTFSQFGEFGIDFMPRPSTLRSDVILPADDLESVLRHTVGMAENAQALRDAGQHLKRGILLYGPPGTGKTHTIGHLMTAMPDRTVVVLHGPSVGALGHAAAIVRSLPPSMLVIEDVDLIAAERSMHPMGGNGLLFQLLNEMDGLGETDDVLFVLTTNRLDLLESALAARPGRIDHAVEIGLPDGVGRRRLLELFMRGVDHSVDSLDLAVARTEGVTGAFIKEVVRRSVSTAIIEGQKTVMTEHLDKALTEMLDMSSPIQAAMLGGVRADDMLPPDMPSHIRAQIRAQSGPPMPPFP